MVVELHRAAPLPHKEKIYWYSLAITYHLELLPWFFSCRVFSLAFSFILGSSQDQNTYSLTTALTMFVSEVSLAHGRRHREAGSRAVVRSPPGTQLRPGRQQEACSETCLSQMPDVSLRVRIATTSLPSSRARAVPATRITVRCMMI